MYYLLKRLIFLLLSGLLLLAPISSYAVGAGCSSFTGKVVLNEYNYIDNWIELKVLDQTLIDGVTNPFTGWNVTVFIEGQKVKQTTQSVAAAYPVTGNNSCGVSTTQYYVQIPFAASDMDNNVNVVLSDASNNIVDVFRLDQTVLSTYFSGYNACTISYSNLTDGPLLGNSSRKDIARLPDGTGPWVQSLGTGNNSETSLCTTNDSMLAVTNTPSVTTIGVDTSFTFTISVANGGTTGTLTNVLVTDLIPAGLTLLSSVPGPVSLSGNLTTYNAITGEWSVGILDATESATLTLTVSAATDGIYTNTATAVATELAPGFSTTDGVVTVSSSNIDHYAFSHSGSGITCTPTDITITPHDVSNVATAPSNTTSITLSTTSTNPGTEAWTLVTGNGTFTPPNSYTFSGTETSVVFGYSQTTAEANIDIDVSDGSATDIDDGDNTNGKDLEDPSLNIGSAGFVFTIPTQISNKTSTPITISAVRADPANPTACTPAFTGARPINFWSSYLSPAPYTGTPALSVNATPVSGATPGTTIGLNFDANAQSTFTTHFADAGKLQLNASYTSTTGTDSGLTLSGSSAFVVTPVGFCVQSTDTNSDCASGDATCSAFVAAGASFNLDVIAKAWESDTDTDLCNGNATTPNYVQSAIPLTHTLIAPTGAGTSSGTLGVTTIDITSGGTANLNNQSISEVGVFTITAAPTAVSYIDGTSVPSGTSVNIGRFYPAAFTTTISNNGSFAAGCSTCSTPFTYLGNNFGYLTTDRPTALITAVNTAGATTVNYQGTFAKLASNPAATIALSYPSSDNTTNNAAGSALLGITTTAGLPTIVDNSNGTLTITLGASSPDLFQYARELVSPFVADLSITLNSFNDGDITTTITTNNVIQPISVQGATTFEQRYGRAMLSDATGSSVAGTVVPIPLALQYYNASGLFSDNIYDTVTAISSAFLGCTDQNTADSLSCIPADVATVQNGGNFTITANGNSGTLLYTLDLTTASGANMEYLMYDWDTNGTDDNTTSIVTLGLYPDYHGEGRFRFWNESN